MKQAGIDNLFHGEYFIVKFIKYIYALVVGGRVVWYGLRNSSGCRSQRDNDRRRGRRVKALATTIEVTHGRSDGIGFVLAEERGRRERELTGNPYGAHAVR